MAKARRLEGKAALVTGAGRGIGRAVARASGIRFYSVNPNATRTAMRAEAYPEEDPASLKAPEAVGPAFVELACDDCRAPSGAAVDLDRATGALRW